MAQPSIKQQILDDLDRMPPELQRRAQELVHGLAASASRPEGTPGKELLRFAGMLDEDAAREMERTIEEGCERVDLDTWCVAPRRRRSANSLVPSALAGSVVASRSLSGWSVPSRSS